jgi:hypothetical protein
MVEAGLASNAAAARSDVRSSGPGCLMPHFWLTYRDGVRLIGVVIIEAPSLIKAAVSGVDGGAPFAKGPGQLLSARRYAVHFMAEETSRRAETRATLSRIGADNPYRQTAVRPTSRRSDRSHGRPRPAPGAMAHFWLTYRDSSCLIGVAIVEAPSLRPA